MTLLGRLPTTHVTVVVTLKRGGEMLRSVCTGRQPLPTAKERLLQTQSEKFSRVLLCALYPCPGFVSCCLKICYFWLIQCKRASPILFLFPKEGLGRQWMFRTPHPHSPRRTSMNTTGTIFGILCWIVSVTYFYWCVHGGTIRRRRFGKNCTFLSFCTGHSLQQGMSLHLQQGHIPC